jgi:hypothetical protein
MGWGGADWRNKAIAPYARRAASLTLRREGGDGTSFHGSALSFASALRIAHSATRDRVMTLLLLIVVLILLFGGGGGYYGYRRGYYGGGGHGLVWLIVVVLVLVVLFGGHSGVHV